MRRLRFSIAFLTATFVLVLAHVLPVAAQDSQPSSAPAGGYKSFIPIVTSAKPPDPQAELAQLINDYRKANGLPAIPVSRSLSRVADLHVKDLYDNHPDSGTDSRGQPCNLHSWSSKGDWSAVCYTPDHKYAEGMWDKPREITVEVYRGNGYEIAYASADPATPQGAFNAWKNSSGHNEVILEQGIWAGKKWPGMGIGIYKGYAVVWFGDTADPEGYLQ